MQNKKEWSEKYLKTQRRREVVRLIGKEGNVLLHDGMARIYNGTGRDKGKFLFSLIAKNGEILVGKSQPYERKATLKRTLQRYFQWFVIKDETILSPKK
jgi:uncharacterized protein YegP (UPF0339 family)